MPGPQKLGKLTPDPSHMDLLNLYAVELMKQFKCHDSGTLQSFDPATQTAQVTINYNRTFAAATPTSKPTYVPYPVLLRVPVFCYGGGGCSLTFPFKLGDTGLVAYNDRDIDNWFQSGQVGPVATTRMHHQSDGMFFPGFRSMAGALQGYDTVRAVLANGSTMVGVGPSLIKIANASTSLGIQLGNLATALETFFTAASAATPVNVSATVGVPAAAAATAITALQTALEGLLE